MTTARCTNRISERSPLSGNTNKAGTRVFRAFEDPEAHYRWFVSGEGWEIANYTHDFRVGGHEHGDFRPDGTQRMFSNDTWYLEITEGQRIVVAYTMSDGWQADVSLARRDGVLPDGIGRMPPRLHRTGRLLWRGRRRAEPPTGRGWSQFGKLADELDTHA